MGPRATIVLAGATGLVGRACVEQLLADARVEAVHVVVRRALGDARVREHVVDFTRLDDQPSVAATAAICALGTTIKAAGSQAAFRAVDHDAVVTFARWARRGGADTFALVSSVGADPAAGSFYLRVKGETEASVRALGFRRLVLLRPSLLLGARADARPGEAIARAVMPAFNPLMLGPLRRYRAVRADVVAAALVRAATAQTDVGVDVWEHDAIAAAAARKA